MADRMAAQIWIGGRLSGGQAEDLCGAIADEGVSLDYGDKTFRPSTPEDLIEACDESDDDDRVLRLCDDQASWGEFADLESFLQEHAIPYTRHGEGGGSYNGEIVEYRPGNDPVCISVDANGSPAVDIDAVRRVDKALDVAMRRLDTGDVRRAARWLKVARHSLCEQLPPAIQPLPSFEIEGYQPREEDHGR